MLLDSHLLGHAPGFLHSLSVVFGVTEADKVLHCNAISPYGPHCPADRIISVALYGSDSTHGEHMYPDVSIECLVLYKVLLDTITGVRFGLHCPTVGSLSGHSPHGNDITYADACVGTNLWLPIGPQICRDRVLPYGNTCFSLPMQVLFGEVVIRGLLALRAFPKCISCFLRLVGKMFFTCCLLATVESLCLSPLSSMFRC